VVVVGVVDGYVVVVGVVDWCRRRGRLCGGGWCRSGRRSRVRVMLMSCVIAVVLSGGSRGL
jgi:hypothetical protein